MSMEGNLGRAIRLIGNIAVTLSVALLLTFMVVSFVLGWRMNPVMTAGMSPTFNVGDVAVIESVEPQAIGVGDVLIYRSPLDGQVTARRVLDIRETEQGIYFQTGTDSSNVRDPYLVAPENITGRAKFQVPVLGHVTSFVRTPLGFALLFGLPGLIITTFEVNRLMFKLIPSHQRRRQAAWSTGMSRKDWLG